MSQYCILIISVGEHRQEILITLGAAKVIIKKTKYCELNFNLPDLI